MQFCNKTADVFEGKSRWAVLHATFSVFLIAAVLLLLFSPVTTGPFSAVYGPATALRASRAAGLIVLGLACAGSILSRGSGLPVLNAKVSIPFSSCSSLALSPITPALRC